ncbi:hypothetical protein D3C78_1779500 [compost metagenome]
MDAVGADHALLARQPQVVGEVALGEVQIAIDLEAEQPADAVLRRHVILLIGAAPPLQAELDLVGDDPQLVDQVGGQ